MNRNRTHLDHLVTVADSLGPLLDQVVFIGGAIVGLLITDPAAPDVRPTDDVDVVIEITRKGQYAILEEKLRSLGFVNDTDGPICRFKIRELKVDVMPTEEKILGFSNKWYGAAMKSASLHDLPNGKKIRLITPVIFVCTKLDAFFDRGNGDYLGSHDLEDIIAVIDGRAEIVDEARAAAADIREYLGESFSAIVGDTNFIASIEAHLPPDAANRVPRILEQMKQLSAL